MFGAALPGTFSFTRLSRLSFRPHVALRPALTGTALFHLALCCCARRAQKGSLCDEAPPKPYLILKMVSQ